jgi:hypothetical protein
MRVPWPVLASARTRTTAVLAETSGNLEDIMRPRGTKWWGEIQQLSRKNQKRDAKAARSRARARDRKICREEA